MQSVCGLWLKLLAQDAALLVESGNKRFNLKGLVPRILKRDHEPATIPCYSVVIVGAGAAGISVASSLLCREPHLDIVIIDPADTHYYQPGWTMVGGGIFQTTSNRTLNDKCDTFKSKMDESCGCWIRP